VHSYFDIKKLKRMAPIQNNGSSASNIAAICKNYIEYKGELKDFLHLQHHSNQPSQQTKTACTE
jgi:hypothetical protein